MGQFFSGAGRKVLKVNISEPVVIVCNNQSQGFFSVQGFTSAGEHSDLVASGLDPFISEYLVSLPYEPDILDLPMLEITARDSWAIEIKDLDECDMWDGRPLTATGSKVLRVRDDLIGSLANFKSEGTSPVTVTFYDSQPQYIDSPIIAMGSLEGQLIIRGQTAFIFIATSNKWTLSL